MNRRITDECIIERVHSESDCKFIRSYYKSQKQGKRLFLELECSCGTAFNVAWVKFNRNDGRPQRQCQNCGEKKRTSARLHDNCWYIKEKQSKGITIENIEEYAGRQTPISHICPQCKTRDWKVTPNNILSKKSTKCRECHTRSIAGHNKGDDEYYRRKRDALGIIIRNKDPYIDNSTPIVHECPSCKEDWMVAPANILAGNKMCATCSYIYRGVKLRKSPKEVRATLSSLGLDWVRGQYRGKDSVLTVMCECGEVFDRRFHDISSGWSRCTKCSMSISTGEYRIQKWLEDKGYSFKHQQKFEDLRGLRNMHLSYDFGVYLNGTLKVLIEYDGGHHFQPIYSRYDTREAAEKSFEATRRRDTRKNEYAKRNGYELIRLSAKDYEKLDAKLAPFLEQYINTEVSENITRHRNA